MSWTYCGNVQFSTGFPLPFAVGAAAGVNAQGNLDAAAAFQVSATAPTIAEKLQLAEQIVAGLQAAAALGIEPPSLSLQLSLMKDLITKLQADMSLYLSLLNLGGLGAWFYHYNGTAGNAGSQLAVAFSTGLPGGGGASEVIDCALVATNTGAAFSGLSQIIKQVP